MPMQEIEAAYQALWREQRRLAATLPEVLPVGSFLCYSLGSHLVYVRVLGHADDRVRVENPETGADYWISAFRVERRVD